MNESTNEWMKELIHEGKKRMDEYDRITTYGNSPQTLASVSAYMFPIICEAIFLVSVDRSLNARCNTGMIRARDGASIKCTNDVCNKTCRHGAVLVDGSINASSNTDEMAETTHTMTCTLI